MLVTETTAVFADRPWEPRDLGVAQEVGLGADFWTSKVLARPSPGVRVWDEALAEGVLELPPRPPPPSPACSTS